MVHIAHCLRARTTEQTKGYLICYTAHENSGSVPTTCGGQSYSYFDCMTTLMCKVLQKVYTQLNSLYIHPCLLPRLYHILFLL